MLRLVVLMGVVLGPNLITATGYWTAWYDRDNPGGVCDCEQFSNLASQYPCGRTMQVMKSECKVKTPNLPSTGKVFSNPPPVWVPNILREACDTRGLGCWNADQTHGSCNSCKDYEVRFKCGCPTATCSCPSGWIAKGERCFIAQSCYSSPCTHDDARRRCCDMGGKLARVMSADDRDFFMSQVFGHSIQPIYMLVDGRDQADENTWVYEDGTAVFYRSDMGNTNHAVRDCLAIRRVNAAVGSRMYYIHCTFRHYRSAFVCEL